MPIHLRANRDDVAPVALLVGDPGRATRIAGHLEGARCYNQNRELLGYTGTFENAPISVQTTGMGGPSAAIVVEELASLGVNTVIRLGTCGAVGPNVKVLDLVVATAAVPADGTTRQYLDGEPFAPVADLAVANALVDACRSLGRPFHTGIVMSQDAFYLQDRDWERWRDRGVLAVEMETSTVFTLALLRRLRAGAVCLAVDDIADRSTWASEEAISAATTDLITAGLAAAHRLSRS
jgi:purine-nucleoside phosphorylase